MVRPLPHIHHILLKSTTDERMKDRNVIVLQAWNFPWEGIPPKCGQGCGASLLKPFQKFPKGWKIGRLSFCRLDIFPGKVFPQHMGRVVGHASRNPYPICYLPHLISDQTLASKFFLVILNKIEQKVLKMSKMLSVTIDLGKCYMCTWAILCYLSFHNNEQNKAVVLVRYRSSYQWISLQRQWLICFSGAFLSTQPCCWLFCMTTPLFLPPQGRHWPKQLLIRKVFLRFRRTDCCWLFCMTTALPIPPHGWQRSDQLLIGKAFLHSKGTDRSDCSSAVRWGGRCSCQEPLIRKTGCCGICWLVVGSGKGSTVTWCPDNKLVIFTSFIHRTAWKKGKRFLQCLSFEGLQ